jgi:hypothetical protein
MNMTKDPFKLKSVPWHKRSRQERMVSLFYLGTLSPEDAKVVAACTDYRQPKKLLHDHSRGSVSKLGGTATPMKGK